MSQHPLRAPTPLGEPSPRAVLSVIVPSVNGVPDLERTLTALEREAAEVPLELLVVDRLGEEVRATVRATFPRAHVIDVPADTTIPAMRMAAFAVACGNHVAVIEDHIVVPRGWARSMLEALGEAQRGPRPAVVGGAVENGATRRVVDWAAFLCEYSHCLTPLPAGPSTWLTGNNVVYPKWLLERYLDRLSADTWENHLHAMMRADGVTLVCRPDIVVAHEKYYTIREYVTQRYWYARSYAGARVSGAAVGKRIAVGMAAAMLPPVLLWRIIVRVLGKRRHRAELVQSIPLLIVFVCAWAAGEVVGSWFGAGRSLQKVR